MSVPFFRGPQPLDLLALASACAAVNAGLPAQASQILSALEPMTGGVYQSDTRSVPSALVATSANFVVVVVQGTTNTDQWILDGLGYFQGDFSGLPGLTHAYFSLAAQNLWSGMRDQVVSESSGRNVVFVGHSMGGAVAQLLTIFAAGAGVPSWICWGIGCPRVGNDTYAAWWNPGFLERVQIQGDPFTVLPPASWSPFGPQWWVPGLPPFQTYAHGGTGYMVDSTGSVKTGETTLSTSEIVDQLSNSGSLPLHYAVTYATYLRAGLPANLPDGLDDFQEPSAIDRVMGGVAASAEIGWPWGPGQPLPLTVPARLGGGAVLDIRLFFGRESWGWSEGYHWNGGSSPPTPGDYNTALGVAAQLAGLRLAMCMDDTKVDWIRVSDPKQYRDALVLAYSNVFGAKGALPSAGNLGSGASDAISVRLQASPTIANRIFVRSFPSNVIAGENLNFANNFGPPWASWVRFIINGDNNLVAQAEHRPPAAVYNLTNLTPLPDRGFSFVLQGIGLGFAKGTVWYISGVPKSSGFGYNGRKVETGFSENVPVAGQTTVYVGGARPVGTPVSGFGRPLSFDVQTIGFVQAEFATSRKVGRPFASLRGRRPTQLPLRL